MLGVSTVPDWMDDTLSNIWTRGFREAGKGWKDGGINAQSKGKRIVTIGQWTRKLSEVKDEDNRKRDEIAFPFSRSLSDYFWFLIHHRFH